MSHETEPTGIKRRTFLKVLGAGSAAAATVGCSSSDVGKLIPYLVSPDNTVPGVSTYYATTCRECAAACGVISETREGRSVKLEGNPAHPLNRGALCARGQSALQGLYNPDRLRAPMLRQGDSWRVIEWDEAMTVLQQRVAQARGQGGLFINQHETGAFQTYLDSWLGSMGMRPHLSVDFEADDAAIEAHRRTYGVAWPRFDFTAARLIVSIGADFLDNWGPVVPQQLDFADARAKLQGAPRFVYVGPRRSLTGLNADTWIPCAPGGELAIVNFLRGQGSAQQAAQASGADAAQLQALANEISAATPALVLAGGRIQNGLDVCLGAAQLTQQRGGGAVRTDAAILAYEGLSRFADLAAAVEQMRAGQVPLVFVRGANPAYFLPQSAKFAEAFGRVPFKVAFSMYPDETTELCDLVLPDLHALESWGMAEVVPGTIALQQPVMDPVFSGTRSAGDVLMQLAGGSATVAVGTPAPSYREWVIGRLPGGAQAFGAALADGIVAGSAPSRTAPAIAAAVMQAPQVTTQSGDFFFLTYPSPVLGDGRGANKPWLQELPDPVTKVLWSSWIEMHPETASRLGIGRGDIVEVTTTEGTVRAPAYLYLGIRPDTVAMALGQGHRSPTLDGWFSPGDSGVQWGYGRYARDIGTNPMNALVATANTAGGFVWSPLKATVTKSSDSETLVSTEGSARQHGRGIARAVVATGLGGLRPAHAVSGTGTQQVPGLEMGVTPDAHGAAPAAAGAAAAQEAAHGGGHDIAGAASHDFLPGLRSPVAADAQGVLGSPTSADHGKDKGMYDPNHPTQMAKRRWAMTIDLARCTGCSACVTACYAENNIPTVGAPWQNANVYAVTKPGFNITRGREMNWIRLERYFEGADDGRFTPDFEARFVPMLCQHCGNAPCEPVCPVYATYHAPDGLNVQVYNRCVGTRYCSNNCPYKVRYFNWFGYGEPDRKQYAFPEPLNWQLNPDVTVRGKGVMEKCTFCVQRIREAENRASLEQRELEADEFTVACAASCPSRAITFGDAADPAWSITRLAEDQRAYHVFEELNTYTAVVYLKKVTHPTPATVAGAAPAGALPPAGVTQVPAPAGAAGR